MEKLVHTNLLSYWLEAIRPKTLIASFSPVLIAFALACQESLPSLTLFFILSCAAILLQITTNLANDYYDFLSGFDTSVRKGPRRMVASGLINASVMKKATFLSLGLFAVFMIPLCIQGGLPIIILGFLASVFSIFYSKGRFSLSKMGLGELFVFVFFGPVAVCSAFYLLTGRFDLAAFCVGFAPGSISTTVLAIANLRDLKEDTLTGKSTLATRFGPSFAKAEIIFFLSLAAIVALCMSYYVLAFATLIYAILGEKSLKTVGPFFWMYTLCFVILTLL